MGKKKQSGRAPVVGDKPFLHIQLRAFAHATEDPDKVRQGLAHAAGFSLDVEADAKRFEKQTRTVQSEGYFHNPIQIVETEITRSAEVRRFWNALLAVPGMRERLHREVEERLDDDLVFWLRLDKQAAHGRTLRLTQGEDVIQVRAKLATYPKDRAVGLSFLTAFLNGGPDVDAPPPDDKGH